MDNILFYFIEENYINRTFYFIEENYLTLDNTNTNYDENFPKNINKFDDLISEVDNYNNNPEPSLNTLYIDSNFKKSIILEEKPIIDNSNLINIVQTNLISNQFGEIIHNNKNISNSIQNEKKKKIKNNIKKKNKLYNKKKNLARYIIRCCLCVIKQEIFKNEIMKFPYMNEKIYFEFYHYFSNKIDKFCNISVIRKHWLENPEPIEKIDGDSFFLQFCKFYIKNKYTKYVLNNKKIEKERKKIYLDYAFFLQRKMEDPENFYMNS